MLLIIILILIDQITKYFFDNIVNTGAAFGILKGYTTLLIIISFVVLIICLYYYIKSKDKNIRLGLSFLISGIIGNLIDRLFLGYVRDFISISIIPVFNLADVFNIIGVIIIIYINLKKSS